MKLTEQYATRNGNGRKIAKKLAVRQIRRAGKRDPENALTVRRYRGYAD